MSSVLCKKVEVADYDMGVAFMVDGVELNAEEVAEYIEAVKKEAYLRAVQIVKED